MHQKPPTTPTEMLQGSNKPKKYLHAEVHTGKFNQLDENQKDKQCRSISSNYQYLSVWMLSKSKIDSSNQPDKNSDESYLIFTTLDSKCEVQHEL